MYIIKNDAYYGRRKFTNFLQNTHFFPKANENDENTLGFFKYSMSREEFIGFLFKLVHVPKVILENAPQRCILTTIISILENAFRVYVIELAFNLM